MYTDREDGSINLVGRSLNLFGETQIETLVKRQGWKPHSLCSTSDGHLLVTMENEDRTRTAVVRFSDYKAIQVIQRDDQGNPIYSSGKGTKYLSENRNLDICVADYGAGAVVVVSEAGKLEFRYTGLSSTTERSFHPYGITTDSFANILTSDYNNNSIHIIDQDGYFLRFINNCGFQRPAGLCVDSMDNLFVTDYRTSIVKKLQYYK